MPGPLTLWIAIADGEHARFVQPDNNNALKTVRALDAVTAHERSRDMGSDRPGRSFESATLGRHFVAPRNDPNLLKKEKFARLVGQLLNEAAASGAFEELVLVAPPHTLREMREVLKVTASDKLVGTLDKDLVKVPDQRTLATRPRMGPSTPSPEVTREICGG